MAKPKAGVFTSEFWLNISTIAAVLSLSLTDFIDKGVVPVDHPAYRIMVYALTAITTVYTISRGLVKAFGGGVDKIEKVYTAPVVEMNAPAATTAGAAAVSTEPSIVPSPTVMAEPQAAAITDEQLASREVYDHTQAA